MCLSLPPPQAQAVTLTVAQAFRVAFEFWQAAKEGTHGRPRQQEECDGWVTVFLLFPRIVPTFHLHILNPPTRGQTHPPTLLMEGCEFGDPSSWGGGGGWPGAGGQTGVHVVICSSQGSPPPHKHLSVHPVSVYLSIYSSELFEEHGGTFNSSGPCGGGDDQSGRTETRTHDGPCWTRVLSGGYLHHDPAPPPVV